MKPGRSLMIRCRSKVRCWGWLPLGRREEESRVLGTWVESKMFAAETDVENSTSALAVYLKCLDRDEHRREGRQVSWYASGGRRRPLDRCLASVIGARVPNGRPWCEHCSDGSAFVGCRMEMTVLERDSVLYCVARITGGLHTYVTVLNKYSTVLVLVPYIQYTHLKSTAYSMHVRCLPAPSRSIHLFENRSKVFTTDGSAAGRECAHLVLFHSARALRTPYSARTALLRQ